MRYGRYISNCKLSLVWFNYICPQVQKKGTESIFKVTTLGINNWASRERVALEIEFLESLSHERDISKRH